MEILPSQYQATIFCNNDDLRPEPNLVQALFSELLQWDVFPNITKEVSININPTIGNNRISPVHVDRLQFISSLKDKRINFLGNRIDIEVFNVNSTYQLADFSTDVVKIFTSIQKIINKRSNRLSLVSNFYCPDNSKAFMDNAYQSLFQNALNIFDKETFPTDWSHRSNYSQFVKINGKEERTNFISSFGKNIQGSIKPEHQGLQFIFDVNTYQNHLEYRFNTADIKSFFLDVVDINQSFIDKTKELFVNI